MKTYLFIFTISPVQSFISQARKTADLYASSRLLSDLCRTGGEEFQKQKGEIIFPDIENESVPNRFLGRIAAMEVNVNEIGKDVEKAVRAKIEIVGREIIKGLKIDEEPHNYYRQLNDYFYIDWLFYPATSDYIKDYTEIEKLLGAVKNLRAFKQNSETGRKCSLSGEQNALFYRGKKTAYLQNDAVEIKGDNSFYLQNGEALSAIGLVKRFYKKGKNYPSTAEIALMDTMDKIKKGKLQDKDLINIDLIKNIDSDRQLFYEENLTSKYFEKNDLDKNRLEDLKKSLKKMNKLSKEQGLKFAKYYAIIAFDGDSMGEWLSGVKINRGNLDDFHKHLTKQLAQFASNVQNKISSPIGSVVYAGGEDFLGFVNLNHLFNIMKELYIDFNKIDLSDFVDEKLTFSAGIAIAHYKTPLSEVLNWARNMERKAKDIGDAKNAFSIAVLKRSGEIQECRYHWQYDGEFTTDWFTKILELTKKRHFSEAFIKNFELEFSRVGRDEGGNVPEMRLELNRLIKRAYMGKREEKDKLVKNMQTVVKNLFNKRVEYDNFIFALHILSFISRELNNDN